MKPLIFVFLMLSVGIVGCSNGDSNGTDEAAPSTSMAQMLSDGKTVYETNCAECHGIDGEGQNPADPYARDENGRYLAPPHDDTGHTWHHDDDLLIKIITEGGSGGEQFNEMPAFGEQLSENEIQAVLAYIKTFWTEEQRTMQRERTDAVRTQ